MIKLRTLLVFLLFSIFGYTQTYPDKIYIKGKAIECKITEVDSNSISYKFKKGEWINNEKIPISAIESYYWISNYVKDADSTKKELQGQKISHDIGCGIQWLADIDYGYGHDMTEIHYVSPLPYFMYRLNLQTSKTKRIGFTVNCYEREGKGFHYGGSLGGGKGVSGAFNFLRLDIGINRFWSFGKRKGTSFGIGCSLGFITYIKTEFVRQTYSISWGSNSENAGSFEGISKINMTMNFEFNQQIKLYKNGALVVGGKAQLETPDGFAGASYAPFYYQSRSGKVAIIYLAYRFWKN